MLSQNPLDLITDYLEVKIGALDSNLDELNNVK